ncbi:MAG: hypothetical protein ACYCSJ_01420 [Acidimicrobiales bacterium]
MADRSWPDDPVDGLLDMLVAVTGTAILAASVVMGIFILGGVVHVLIRSGRDAQRLTQVEDDLRSLREDVRELFLRATGQYAPSERRERAESGRSGVDSPVPQE